MAGEQLGYFLCSGLCHQIWKDTGLWNRVPAPRAAIWKCLRMWGLLLESWEWTSVSFQSGPSAGGGLPLAQKTLYDFYNNSVEQTRKSRLFSLIDWLVSLWNLPALSPSPHPVLGLQIHSAFPWGLGSERSSHFLHSKHYLPSSVSIPSRCSL